MVMRICVIVGWISDSEQTGVAVLLSTPACSLNSQLSCPGKVTEGEKRRELVRKQEEETSLYGCRK